MTEPEEYDQFRGVRRLFRWLAIVTVLGVCLAMGAVVYVFESVDSDEQAAESARNGVEGLASVLDISMSDEEIITVIEARNGFYPQIARKPGSITVFVEFEGYASGIPYGGTRLVCFRLVILAKPRTTVFEHEEMCPSAAPSSTPPPPS